MNLPVREDLERWLLGAAIASPNAMDTLRPELTQDDFTLTSHKLIWKRGCELYDAGEPFDRVTLFTALQAHGELQAVTLSYIADLENDLPAISAIPSYIERLKETTVRRRIMQQAQHLMNRAADTSDSLDSILTAFADASVELSRNGNGTHGPVSSSQMIETEGAEKLLQPLHHRGLKLPWHRLDEATCGLGGGQVMLLMAETSRGKTSMALQVAACAAEQGKVPVIWTMEMSPFSLMRRMVTQLSGVYVGSRFLTKPERESQSLALVKLNDHPIYFDSHSRTVGSFLASLRQVRAKTGLALGIVDYIQRIRPTARMNRAQEVSDNSRAIKDAAMDLDIPMLVLSQVDRASVKGEHSEIGLHSGKESGDIENDADIVTWIKSGVLSRDYDTAVELAIGKQREGPAGFSIPMVFKPQSQTFVEVQGD